MIHEHNIIMSFGDKFQCFLATVRCINVHLKRSQHTYGYLQIHLHIINNKNLGIRSNKVYIIMYDNIALFIFIIKYSTEIKTVQRLINYIYIRIHHIITHRVLKNAEPSAFINQRKHFFFVGVV